MWNLLWIGILYDKGLVYLSERKNSIRRKYGLENYVGKLGNELALMEDTNFPMMLDGEDLQKLTVGNLNSYTKNILEEGVLEMMKGLKSDYRPIGVDYGKN